MNAATLGRHTHPVYSPRRPWWEWACPACAPKLYDVISRLDPDKTLRRVECPWCAQTVSYRAGRTSKHQNQGETCRGSLLSLMVSQALFRCVRDGQHPSTIRLGEYTPPGKTVACAAILRQLEQGRRRAGLTGPQVSASLGRRPAAVSAWETGAQAPSMDVVIAWAHKIGLAVELRLPVDGSVRAETLADAGQAVEHLLLQRRRMKLSQWQVCTLAGFGNSSLSRWEAREQTPHLATYLTWAMALGGKLELRPTGKRA